MAQIPCPGLVSFNLFLILFDFAVDIVDRLVLDDRGLVVQIFKGILKVAL